jgi:hypothetical protein
MFVLFALAAVLLSGCQTNKVDWNSRIGNYTFTQAVLDMGPPNKQARLEDGTVVAEWETQRGYAITTYAGGYYGRYGYYGGFVPAPVTTMSPSYFLRLTFGPDGRLTAWKRVAL